MFGNKILGKSFLGQKQNLRKSLGSKDNSRTETNRDIPNIDMSSFIVNSHNNEDVKNEPILGKEYKPKSKQPHSNIEKPKNTIKSKSIDKYV